MNFYIDRQQDTGQSNESRINDEKRGVNVTFDDVEPKTTKERWTQVISFFILKIIINYRIFELLYHM